jgi:iron complex outermembrane receptor protein
MNNSQKFLLITASASALFANSGAFAQDAAKQPAETQAAREGSGDIIVTAQRREQNLQKTPIAISVFNETALQQRGVVKLENIAASTPGLNITAVTASPNAIMISMRGAFEQNGGTSTSESPVAIYIDDVYQSRLSAANYDLADIARVEVLRGPQGTLYGRNSMTGAMKLITRQPNGDFWLNTDASYATFDEAKAKVSVGAPLGKHLAIAASGFFDDRHEGWEYDEVLKKRVGTFKRYGAQVSLGLYDIDNVEAVLSGRYSAALSDGQYFAPLDLVNGGSLANGFYNTRTPRQAEGDTRQRSVSLHLGYDTGPVKFRSISAYENLSDNWALDFSGGYDSPFTGTTIAGFFRTSVATQHQFTQEFQALGKGFDDRLNWIVGAFFFDEVSHQSFTNDDLAAFGLTYAPSAFHMNSKSIAGYGQGDYKITDKLTASAGVRFSHDKKIFNGVSPFGPGLNAPLGISNTGIRNSVWTPRFNLQYDITPTAMVYATVDKGYRAGGFNSLVIGDPADYGSPYKPESVWSYEGGLKIQGFDRKAHLNLVGYYEKLSDLQTLADIGGGSFITQNAAGSRIYGIEWEAGVNPVTGLSLFASGAYTNDKYTKLDPTSQAAQLGATRLPLISRWQWQFGGAYEHKLGETLGSVVFAGDVNHRSPYFAQIALYPQSKVPSFTRGNASVTYKSPGDHVEVYFQGTNITAAKNYSTALVFIPGVFGTVYPQEPRILRVGFRYKY